MVDDRDFNKSRSSGYQHFLLELSCSPQLITDFSDMQGIHGYLNDFRYNEELHDLKELLKKEFWRLVEEELTERQQEVLKLCAEGLTQIEIAKLLKVNQSSVTKSLNGNTDYRGSKKKVYGGAKKKLKKLIEKDEKIQQIFRRIAEIQEVSF